MGPATLRSDAIFDGVIHETSQVQYLDIDVAASADLVALVTGKKIRVLGLVLVAAGSVTAQLQSGGSTNLTGAMSMVVGVPLVWPATQFGYTQTASGAKLNLVLGGSVQVSGTLIYALI